MTEKRGVQPRGEPMRSAMKWLSEQRKHDPKAPRAKLLEEAALRFDLTPLDADFLSTHWKEQ
ncbi:MAG TPA: hypothetical protein VMG32_01080 [Anaeromyxobacteraceae bacterium]|nr:hypothetical protein [Anaeromyxobacteraceae bacterium]